MGIIIKKEGIILEPGGRYDRTLVFSPELIKINDLFRLFYVGSSCRHSTRRGYRILLAESKDGIHFVKRKKPVIDIPPWSDKVYSCSIVKINNSFKMYYATHENGGYLIRSAASRDCLNFKINKKIVIDVNKYHQAIVHTPKVKIKRGLFHCYYAGSNEGGKIYSKRYPKHDFAKGFRIFYSTSKDGENFDFKGEVNFIPRLKFINYYGHNFIFYKNYILLFFAGFDGNINRIYLAKSKDGLNFDNIKCIIKPNKNKNELGYYSCEINPLSKNLFRIYYGVRYFDDSWRIHSALLNISKYF